MVLLHPYMQFSTDFNPIIGTYFYTYTKRHLDLELYKPNADGISRNDGEREVHRPAM